MATLKEMFSTQLQDLQADLSRQTESVEKITAENEELRAKGQ